MTGTSEGQLRYQLTPDANHRMCTDIAPGMRVGITVLGVTDRDRIEKGEHAYAVLDIDTPFGNIRIREIRILWSKTNKRFFLRWKQWKTGRRAQGRPQWLAIAAPQDKDSRAAFEEAIVAVFLQIQEEGQLGTLGQARRGPQFMQETEEQVDGPAASDEPLAPADSLPVEEGAIPLNLEFPVDLKGD